MFDELLRDLGAVMDLELHADENSSCLIQFEGDLELQIEPSDDQILYGVVVGHIAAGPARTLLFQAALMANDQHLPGTGVFAYSRHTDQLVLHDALPLEGISAEMLASSIELLLETGREWREAIRRGITPEPKERR